MIARGSMLRRVGNRQLRAAPVQIQRALKHSKDNQPENMGIRTQKGNQDVPREDSDPYHIPGASGTKRQWDDKVDVSGPDTDFKPAYPEAADTVPVSDPTGGGRVNDNRNLRSPPLDQETRYNETNTMMQYRDLFDMGDRRVKQPIPGGPLPLFLGITAITFGVYFIMHGNKTTKHDEKKDDGYRREEK